jgi:hypothetical protein
MALRITGTFLDEITHDIPSQNWGREDWRKEFALYKRIGIDTVIIIRAGYQNKCIFQARSIPDLLPIHEDLAQMFLDLAEEYGLSVYFGLYDSGYYWIRRTYWKEIELNLGFIDEVVERYGNCPAFKGWYMCHETGKDDAHIVQIFNQLGKHCKDAKNVPVLISPYPQGSKQLGSAGFTLAESFDHWDRIFDETKGAFDICAFQDGQVHYQELPAFTKGIADLGSKHGVTIWSNLETFDRDMPIKFPPADWRYLRFKLDTHKEVAEKIITFEFAHFMSPHSCYPSAHNLFKRYCEHFGIEASHDEWVTQLTNAE